jgi:hypothetical protein
MTSHVSPQIPAGVPRSHAAEAPCAPSPSPPSWPPLLSHAHAHSTCTRRSVTKAWIKQSTAARPARRARFPFARPRRSSFHEGFLRSAAPRSAQATRKQATAARRPRTTTSQASTGSRRSSSGAATPTRLPAIERARGVFSCGDTAAQVRLIEPLCIFDRIGTVHVSLARIMYASTHVLRF